MKINATRIVDQGRGPQIEGHRLTVLDVYYYLRRGYDFEVIHQAMPSLTREQFGAVLDYVDDHRVELDAADERVEERIRRGIEDQRARGLSRETDDMAPVAERVERLKQKLNSQLAKEQSRGPHSG